MCKHFKKKPLLVLLNIFFLLWTSTPLLYATPTDIYSLKEIMLHNKKAGMVVFLDVDDHLLSVRRYFPDSHKYLVHPQKEYRLLEADVAQTIQKIRHSINNDPSKVIVLGLTKRPLFHPDGKPDEADTVIEKEGIPLSRSDFSQFNGQKLLNNANAGYRNGVIYTNRQEKSAYAEAFFKLAGINPPLVIFSDDHRPNSQEMLDSGKVNGRNVESYHLRRVELLHDFIKGEKKHPEIKHDFDPEKYLHHNPDILESSQTRNVSKQLTFAQQHYVKWGQTEGRFVDYPDHFSPQEYLDYNKDVLAYAQTHRLDPLTFAWEHYRHYGQKENRFIGYPSHFSPQRYLDLNKDILIYAQTHGLDPLGFAKEHFRQQGHKEGRKF